MHDDSRQSEKAKKLAIVLGVHRSGTSLLAAGLRAIGARLGAVDPFAEEDNPKGYFEHKAIRDFNDELMKNIGVSWDNWGFYSPDEKFEDRKFDQWRQRAADLLQECFDGPGQWGLKEPRMTTLLPFWNTVFAQLGWQCKRLLILRHPGEVAESQQQRFLRRPEHFKVITEPEPMHALWAITMHGVLSCLPDDETFLVRHEDLYADPESTLLACADFLGLSPDAGTVADFALNFVDPSLWRAKAPARSSDGAWGDLARDFHRSFDRISTPGRLTRKDAVALADQQQSLKAQLPFLHAVRSSIGRLAEGQLTSAQHLADIYIPTYDTIRRAIGLDSDALNRNEVTIPSDFFRFLFEVILRMAHFDEEKYRLMNADLAEAEKDGRIASLYEHFLKTGWFEGRTPGEYGLDEAWYLNAYEDIALAVREGRLESVRRHFSEIGRAEGRVGSPEQSRWKDLWNGALKLR
jgi:hypothetical protein